MRRDDRPGNLPPNRTPASGDLDLRPAGLARGLSIAGGLTAVILALLVKLFYSARDAGAAPATWWIIIAAAALIAAGAVARMVRRLQLTKTSIIVTRVLARPRSYPRSELGTGILVQQYLQYGSNPQPLLILVNSSGEKMLHLTGPLFSSAELVALARGIGLESFHVITGGTTPKMLDAEHRGLLWFGERRPWAFAFLTVGVIIVVTVVALRASGV